MCLTVKNRSSLQTANGNIIVYKEINGKIFKCAIPKGDKYEVKEIDGRKFCFSNSIIIHEQL